jgi:hypothetical protein
MLQPPEPDTRPFGSMPSRLIETGQYRAKVSLLVDAAAPMARRRRLLNL